MKDLQFAEALQRMEMLQLSKQCISAFKQGKVWESEGYGALYEVDDEEQKIINDFEKENNALVYHMIHDRFEFGECYSILYVSQYKSEWSDDRNDIKEGYALVYVKNVTDDICSEFGSIAIRPSFGGLVRLQ